MDKRRKIFVGAGLLLTIWLVLFTGIIGGVIGYFAATRFFPPATTTITTTNGRTIQVTSEESAVIKVVEKASPAVVSVVAKGVDPFSGEVGEQSIGTGFIVDATGIVVTNSHVVSDEDATYTVVTKDKKTYAAKNISRDPLNDVAFFKIEGQDFPILPLGDSTSIKVGQTVIAIGNSLGKFDNTVTTGVVSGFGREVTLFRGDTLEDLIQTDAAINPGNSGGPLLNLAGEVIGINTLVAATAQNIGFAVPSKTARAILDNYLKNGRIIRPFLGVQTDLITKELAKINEVPEGAIVRRVVEGSAAERAGIKRNDIITDFGDKKISATLSLAKAVSSYGVGDTVSIKLWRDEEVITIQATLTEAP